MKVQTLQVRAKSTSTGIGQGRRAGQQAQAQAQHQQDPSSQQVTGATATNKNVHHQAQYSGYFGGEPLQ